MNEERRAADDSEAVRRTVAVAEARIHRRRDVAVVGIRRVDLAGGEVITSIAAGDGDVHPGRERETERVNDRALIQLYLIDEAAQPAAC